MTPVGGSWWAAYVDGDRAFVVPILCLDEGGMPYVWSAETHRPVPAVRTAFIGIVSDGYRGEYGDLIASAIARAADGHAGDASPSDNLHEKVRDGVEKARDAIHAATEPER
jgi:hypothetical protein